MMFQPILSLLHLPQPAPPTSFIYWADLDAICAENSRVLVTQSSEGEEGTVLGSRIAQSLVPKDSLLV